MFNAIRRANKFQESLLEFAALTKPSPDDLKRVKRMVKYFARRTGRDVLDIMGQVNGNARMGASVKDILAARLENYMIKPSVQAYVDDLLERHRA